MGWISVSSGRGAPLNRGEGSELNSRKTILGFGLRRTADSARGYLVSQGGMHVLKSAVQSTSPWHAVETAL